MSYVLIGPETYRRLAEFSAAAGISVHHAANDAVDNWLDIATDPRLAVAALTAIVTATDGPQSAPAPLPANVIPINAVRPGLRPPHPAPSSRPRAPRPEIVHSKIVRAKIVRPKVVRSGGSAQ